MSITAPPARITILAGESLVWFTSRGFLSADGAGVPHVPWIAWGAGIKAGHAIKQPVSILDTGATVLRTLGLETYTEWESHAVEEIFNAPRPANTGAESKGP